MQIKRTEFKGIAEDVTILDGHEAQKALVRIANYHQVPLDVIRNELTRGWRITTCGAMYEVNALHQAQAGSASNGGDK